MSVTVLRPGAQMSVQGGPYAGLRHLAIPASGAADPLSLALANRLVGKPLDAAAIEVTLGGAQLRIDAPLVVAVTGADCAVTVNGERGGMHRQLTLESGDTLELGPVRSGCRNYVALSRDLALPAPMGSQSTCLSAGFGGVEGRALHAGDTLDLGEETLLPQEPETPRRMRPYMSSHVVLRVVPGPESERLADGFAALTERPWRVSRRSNRMGLKLEGGTLAVGEAASMPSGPVFPGTIQCPPDGEPYLLGPDSQTTGGYPRIAQVIRADRHLIGQLSDVDIIRLIAVDADQARTIYQRKLEMWQPWLPGLSLP